MLIFKIFFYHFREMLIGVARFFTKEKEYTREYVKKKKNSCQLGVKMDPWTKKFC